MKLFVSNNLSISCLKIATVGEFYTLEIELIPSNPKGSGATDLQLFEADDGSTYFSSNAACRYLVEKSGIPIKDQVDQWLEWELTILQPSMFVLMKESRAENALVSLRNNLCYLDVVLGHQAFFSGEGTPDLSDITMWSNLGPLWKACSFCTALNLRNIERWISSLETQPAFQRAFSKVFQAPSDLKTHLWKNQFLRVDSNRFFMPVAVDSFKCDSNDANHIPEEETEVTVNGDITTQQITECYSEWLRGLNALPKLREVTQPILPREGERNVLITSALPYVNNVPHLGNIIGAVLSADVFARYCRLRGFNTLYVCGTDEYGTATETKAIELGVTPKEICDRYNKLHTEIYQWFNISFDYFGRTTTKQQTVIAQDIFMKLYKKDLFVSETVEQLYCGSCKRFLADRFVEGVCPFCQFEDARGDQCDKCGKLINAPELKNPTCKVCRSTPQMKSSRHLFLDLPKLAPVLKEHLDDSTASGNWSNTAKVITYAWLKDGLKPRCITRDLKWGTPVPLEEFKDKVFYVWFDAPIGYLSITANYTDEWERWWKQPEAVQLYQFMAKDNVPFHSIIFPTCQIGTRDGYTLVNHLAATEYLNYEDVKFSKSRGLGVFGDDARDTGIPSDIWRFYLLYIRPESQDTFFSWSDLMLKNNSELLNNLGNFINRCLSFISNNFGGVIPEMTLEDKDKSIVAQVTHELRTYISNMEKLRLRDAIKPMLNISRIGNQYIQGNKPWVLMKGSPAEKSAAGTVLGLSANVCGLLCTLMEPYMPETCASLKRQLNTRPQCHVLGDAFVCLLPPGHRIGKPVPLFKKIEAQRIDELKAKYSGNQANDKTEAVKTPAEKPVMENAEVESLMEMVTKQGEKVRQLKAEKAEKAIVNGEVSILLDLKNKLCLAKGEEPPQQQSKSKKKR